jgi:hypothetical protein
MRLFRIAIPLFKQPLQLCKDMSFIARLLQHLTISAVTGNGVHLGKHAALMQLDFVLKRLLSNSEYP